MASFAEFQQTPIDDEADLVWWLQYAPGDMGNGSNLGSFLEHSKLGCVVVSARFDLAEDLMIAKLSVARRYRRIGRRLQKLDGRHQTILRARFGATLPPGQKLALSELGELAAVALHTQAAADECALERRRAARRGEMVDETGRPSRSEIVSTLTALASRLKHKHPITRDAARAIMTSIRLESESLVRAASSAYALTRGKPRRE